MNLKKQIENLKESVAEREDKDLTKLKTENLKLKYQITHLEKVNFILMLIVHIHVWHFHYFKSIISEAREFFNQHFYGTISAVFCFN